MLRMLPEFVKIARDAAELLGWGRNTLTRKIKDLALEL